MWNGVLTPFTKAATLGIGNPLDPENPVKADTPLFDIPSEGDLEVWMGWPDPDEVGDMVAWSYDNITYITVRFHHFPDVPSNDTWYTYIYDENDLEDIASGEFGGNEDEGFFDADTLFS